MILHEPESALRHYLYAQEIRGRTRNTLKAYRYFIGRFLRELGKPIDRIDTFDIREFLMREKQSGNSESTIATKINYLRSFFAWLYREEIIMKDPAAKIDPIPQRLDVPKFLTHEEVELLREACTEMVDRCLVEVLYSAGLRVSEASRLEWRDIDFPSMSLRVREGKGDKDRVVPFSTKARLLLQKMRQQRNRQDDFLPCVFRSRHNRAMSPSSIERRIRALGEVAGIKERVTPHRLRHSLATHLLESGMPIDAIQKVLGHERIHTTQIYAKTQQRNVEIYYRRVIA
ncbi:MAG TPA: site-specific tyrosine recombinase/integron integrase [Limnochordia bacterium]|nr:site-specific tyrosine recombinase/integron integrase [Limnochordia bacterium]